MTATRMKIRNCIRENTFRYYFDSVEFASIWKHLEKNFGASSPFGLPNLLQIETSDFILRSSINTATITVIQKPRCQNKALDQFHNIIDFKDVL